MVCLCISVSFATTINKSQVQSLSKVGLYLPRLVFTHRQLYVALSRVKSKKGLNVVVSDADDNLSNTTINVLYKEVLQCLCSNDQQVCTLYILNVFFLFFLFTVIINPKCSITYIFLYTYQVLTERSFSSSFRMVTTSILLLKTNTLQIKSQSTFITQIFIPIVFYDFSHL